MVNADRKTAHLIIMLVKMEDANRTFAKSITTSMWMADAIKRRARSTTSWAPMVAASRSNAHVSGILAQTEGANKRSALTHTF